MISSKWIFHFSILGHTCAEDVGKKIEESTQNLNHRILVQISMDGSNVDWKFYDIIAGERNEKGEYPCLIDVKYVSHYAVLKAVHDLFDD